VGAGWPEAGFVNKHFDGNEWLGINVTPNRVFNMPLTANFPYVLDIFQ